MTKAALATPEPAETTPSALTVAKDENHPPIEESVSLSQELKRAS